MRQIRYVRNRFMDLHIFWFEYSFIQEVQEKFFFDSQRTGSTTKVSVCLKLPTDLAICAAAEGTGKCGCRHARVRSTVLATCVPIVNVLQQL